MKRSWACPGAAKTTGRSRRGERRRVSPEPDRCSVEVSVAVTVVVGRGRRGPMAVVADGEAVAAVEGHTVDRDRGGYLWV